MQTLRFCEKPTTTHIILHLPEDLVNKRLEIIVLELDEKAQSTVSVRKRKPPVELSGKVKEYGDVLNSASPEEWGVAG